MSQLAIHSLTNAIVKAGVLTEVIKFIVTNEAGELVGRKAHDTQEEAEAERETLKGYAEGLEFAKAHGLEGKNAVGKANVIADYLAWVAAGRPDVGAAEQADPEVDPVDPNASF